MADADAEEDLFADLYDGEDVEPTAAPVSPKIAAPSAIPPPVSEPVVAVPRHVAAAANDETNQEAKHYEDEEGQGYAQGGGYGQEPDYGMHEGYSHNPEDHMDSNERPIGIKEDGKMFIGGLNWETTDEKMRDYFSQFGEVVECTVMRDGATGRSRGFGFLTFKDPKVVNTVMVKEHTLDNKLIDPKRAIPRDEQERTAKIFVGGVSQEATENDFKTFFMKFGRVLDATLMMDKDTGRPRGFGFVTFDSDTAVDRTLEGPLAIHGKPIEVKRAQPRGSMREEVVPGNNKFGRHNKQESYGGFGAQEQMGQDGPPGANNMSPAMMAQYWQRMQQYFQMMQQQMAVNSMGGMNPMQAMQNNPAMMQQMMARQNVNPAMMQQMGNMQNFGQGMGQGNARMNQMGPAFNNQEQQMYDSENYDRQNMARMSQQDFNGQNTWEGMYDDVPAPAGIQGGSRGGMSARGTRGGRGGGATPVAGQAPAGAPTGPKNAGRPGSNYRGGGRGGHRGFHPYARGGS